MQDYLAYQQHLCSREQLYLLTCTHDFPQLSAINAIHKGRSIVFISEMILAHVSSHLCFVPESSVPQKKIYM